MKARTQVRDLFRMNISVYPAGSRQVGRRRGNSKVYPVLVDINLRGTGKNLYTIEVYEVVPNNGYFENPFITTKKELLTQGVRREDLK